jgi:[calcium/calmodulin-dependent protein kinase] kinase
MKAITKFKTLLSHKGATEKAGEPRTTHVDGPGDAREGAETVNSQAASGSEIDEEAQQKAAADHAAQIISERERFLEASSTTVITATHSRQQSLGEKGHAHDVTDVEAPFLGIGNGDQDAFAEGDIPTSNVLSDSPTAVHFNVYDRAFEEEVDKIKRSTSGTARQGRSTTLYLTKHLRDEKKFRTMEDPEIHWVGNGDEDDEEEGTEKTSAAEKFKLFAPRSGPNFAELVAGAVREAKNKAQEAAGLGQDEATPDRKVEES